MTSAVIPRHGRGVRTTAAALAFVLGGALLPGCSEGRDADAAACAAVERTEARVRPILDDGMPTTAEEAQTDPATRETLSQWTFDLADASATAADTDLRELIRRAADEAHTAYAGNTASFSTYDDFLAQVRERCAALGAADQR